jgi:lipid II:glycine glycyltransferase (peptidoglycan interpeptide bridge formation enzyme)
MAALMHALHADGATSLDLWGVLEEGHEGEEPGWGGFSQFKRKFGGLPLEHPGTFELIVDPFWYRLRDLRERLAGGA